MNQTTYTLTRQTRTDFAPLMNNNTQAQLNTPRAIAEALRKAGTIDQRSLRALADILMLPRKGGYSLQRRYEPEHH